MVINKKGLPFYLLKNHLNSVSTYVNKLLSKIINLRLDIKFDLITEKDTLIKELQNNIENLGSWLSMMSELMGNGDEPYLDFRIPDYADSSLVDRYINETFGDYI